MDCQRARIRRYILRLVRNPAEADDLTQETFLRAHAKLASLRDETALTAWLYRIATHICYDRFRQASRLPPHDALDDVPEQRDSRAPRLDALLERAEMSACVQDFIAELPDNYRSVILLHDLHDLTSREIADMQGCTVETAKIRLHRARARLRTALAQGCHFSHDERSALVCRPRERSTAAPTPRSRSHRSR
jgi:RNA polymerase sigma-70 factor (ECF subfamily)